MINKQVIGVEAEWMQIQYDEVADDITGAGMAQEGIVCFDNRRGKLIKEHGIK